MFEKYSWYDKLPDEKLEEFEPNKRLFFQAMFERQTIWKRRFIDKKEKPWTDDKILNEYKFTNVYRELDRNSQWQIKNIILDDSLTLKNLIWKMMFFRFFNNIKTFTDNGWRNGIPDWNEYNEDKFSKYISEVRLSGRNPYTSAYLINSLAAPGKSRDYCYTKIVIPSLHKSMDKIIAKVITAKKPEDIIEYLKTFPSVSDFLAHEFYQDFTHISKYTNRKFMKFDQNDFTNVGPGASIGIRLIFPNLKTSKEQKQAIYWLRDESEYWLRNVGRVKYGSDKEALFPYLYFNKEKYNPSDKDNLPYYITNRNNITLHQIEMWLCEFQKYWKMIIGEGKQRSKFIPKIK